MVLLEVRLEWRRTCVGRLVTKSSAGASHEIIVVFSDAALALLHAPENESNTTKEKSTANTSNYAADNLLVALSQTAAVVAATVLRLRKISHKGRTGGGKACARACRGDL